MDADIYLSPFGKSRISKAKKIKTFAIHKPSRENSKSDYIVVAANDKSEIIVSFNGRSDCKVFSFDKVFCDDESQGMLYDSLVKSIVQDVVMGLSSFLILCNLAFPYNICGADSNSFPVKLSANSLVKNILKELLIYTANEENFDSSLHASYFEVHDGRIVDLLNKNSETGDLKILKVFQQNYMEIKDLTVKTIANENDITDIFTKQSRSLFCHSSICHSIFTASLIKKNESCNEFDSMKVGKLFVVDFAKCKDNVLGENIFVDCDLKIPQDMEFTTTCSKNQLFDILKPAFGGSGRTILLASLSSYLHSPERDLSLLQFIAQLHNVYNYPEIDIKMIIPTSLLEYSKEIQELQKDLAAIEQKTGVKIEPPLYRYFKNSATVEEEKLKIFGSYLSLLSDSNNSKKHNLISTHSAAERIENEIKEEEKRFETLKMELKKLQEQNDAKQKSSVKAYEIIKMKQMKNIHDFNLKKIKSDLTVIHGNLNEITQSIKSLNGDMVSIACEIESERTFLKQTLVLLVNDIQSALPELQIQNNDLMMKLNSLSTVDVLFDSWKINTENLLTSVSDFVVEQCKNFNSFNFKIFTHVMPLQTFKSEVMKIIENNKIESSPILFCLVHKIKVLSDSLLKILAEIFITLEVIQNCLKTELTTLGAIISSSTKTYKKFFDEIGSVLKLSLQYNEELGSEAKEIADLVFFHHKFKKHFDGQLNDVKHLLLMLKQSCISQNDVAVSKWNDIHKSCLKTSQEHSNISENLTLIKKQMSLQLNQALQKMTSFNCSQLKEETKNAQKKTEILLQNQEEIKSIFATAAEINDKGMVKEMQEMKKYTDSQKIEVEKCFNDYYLKMKKNFNSFMNDLQTLLNNFSNNEEEMKQSFCHLSSLIPSVSTLYDNYWRVLKNIYGKSESALKKLPPVINVTVDKNEDNLSELESIYLDEWNVISSTPKVAEVRQMDVQFEKEKMLGRIRSAVEQQMLKKLNVGGLDNEEKEENNLSTISLPNFGSNRSIYAKAYQTSENVFKAKFSSK